MLQRPNGAFQFLTSKGDKGDVTPSYSAEDSVSRRARPLGAPPQAELGTERFKGCYVGLVAPEGDVCAQFVLLLLGHALGTTVREPIYQDEDTGELWPEPAADEPDPVDVAILAALLERAAGRMTSWQRTVFMLRLEGYGFSEIGRYFHRTEGSPRAAYRRACLHIRAVLTDWDVTVP